VNVPVLKRIAAGLGATAVALVAPASGQATGLPTPDHFETANVKFIANYPEAGDGTGAKVVGNYLYVTSSIGLFIYDISTPTNPVLVNTPSQNSLNAEFENEEVPTNGKILGISNSLPECNHAITSANNCLDLYDVTDKANPQYLASVVGAGDHTNACIFDCTYFWGSSGHVTDARDPRHPKLIGMWNDPKNKLPANSAHHVREIVPGIIFTATQPFMLVTVRAEDGADILHPKLIATGENADHRFIHSNRWPNKGTDIFALVGGETNFQPRCGLVSNGAFMTWDASKVIDGSGGWNLNSQFKQIDEYRVQDGVYTDGGPPVNILGCSVHWFEENPTFHNGGLVALASYESGTRFLQITADGKIKEQGYYIPIARGSTSAPHWAADGKTLYSIDYERGFDVIQWLGPTYVPGASTSTPPAPAPSPAASPTANPVPPSTGGATPLPQTSAGGSVTGMALLLAALVAGLAAIRRKGEA
jgi:hypothetical protein